MCLDLARFSLPKNTAADCAPLCRGGRDQAKSSGKNHGV